MERNAEKKRRERIDSIGKAINSIGQKIKELFN